MEVDFNNLRRHIIRDWNDLVEKLQTVKEDTTPADFEKVMKDLRDGIVTLACCYDDDAGIVSLADEKIAVFQPEPSPAGFWAKAWDRNATPSQTTQPAAPAKARQPVSDFQVLDRLADENTPDGIGMFPTIIKGNLTTKGGHVTFGIHSKAFEWFRKGTHHFIVYGINKADFLRIKTELENQQQ